MTRNSQWRFRNSITICETCGFTFLSPCFLPEQLTEYYQDSYARFGGQALDFSPEKRLAFIDQVLGTPGMKPVKDVIELGGNAATPFQEGLRARFDHVASYEPNAECGSDFGNVEQVPAHAFDLLVHYFILEHIAAVRPFLAQCHRMLRPGGIMIVEVPDLLIYPRDIAALILHEHCNHFTVDNLSHLAAQEGFRLVISSSEQCSRSFGFVAAFERLPDGSTTLYEARVFERNIAALTAGVQRVQAFRDLLERTRRELRAAPDQKVVFWGANDNLVKLLPHGESLPNVTLVDSDPRKTHYHPSLTATLPQDAIDALKDAARLVLFTRLHAPAILNWIEENAGRRFTEVTILDY